ncbi:hypothetical protein PV721_00655 [Streptomyces sp. MB09-01]|uniref:hypothetical protein n=1 Tax=Streptomyces sp. MB09-01 TaxID=3028666 RepID=UPI0029B26B8D|nr:hypothetical protein [Streptomyces sp. MB09-01]MDX3532907.1 hypothetical protein [Streptomyces sp. MB09-01]
MSADVFEYVPADDPRFGRVDLRLDGRAGELIVEGEAVPRAVVRRAAGTRLESHVPIGTRDMGRVTMTVDGAGVQLLPAKGFLTRRSYRVDAGRYRLVPCSLGESRLLLDGKRIGVFSSVGDGRVWARWQQESRRTPEDAAVGYALAAAFGTGAEPMWKLTLDAALSLFG